LNSFRPLQWIVLWAALVLPAAHGQVETWLHVDVPFGFHIDGRKFPAGEYMVRAGSASNPVLIESKDMKYAQFLLTNPVSARTPVVQPRLVFTRYGDDYFLSTIWPGSDTGRQLRPSRQETELARRFSAPAEQAVAGSFGPRKH
jgi:hypothetical protein